VCPLRGQSLGSRLAAQPGVERIMGTPPQMNGRNPSEFWGTLWVSCGVLCLIPSCLVAAAYYAHLLGDRQFWSGADFLSLLSLRRALQVKAWCSVGLRMRPAPMAAWSRPGQDGPSLDPQKFRLKKGPQPGEGSNTLTTLACRYDAVRRRHHGPLKQRLLRAASDRQAHRLGKMPPFPAGAGTQFAEASVAASLGHQPSAHPAQQGAANGTANGMRFNLAG
jgi:hypothetical protein